MTDFITAYSYDKLTQEYIGETTARKDPKDPNNYIVPGFSTVVQPNIQEGYKSIWNGNSWYNEEIVPEPEPIKTLEELKQIKKDDLFLQVSNKIAEPVFYQTIGVEDCYVSTNDKGRFFGTFSTSGNFSKVRYFRAVDINNVRLSHDLHISVSELNTLSESYEDIVDNTISLKEGYIDQIDAATTVGELDNINFIL